MRLLPFFKFWILKFGNCVIPECEIVLKLHIWTSHGKIADAYVFELSPLVKYGPLKKIKRKFISALSRKALSFELLPFLHFGH